MTLALGWPATWRNKSVQKLMAAIALCFCQIVWSAENPPPVQKADDAAAEEINEQTESEQVSEQKLADAEQELILADIEKSSEAEEESAGRFIPTEQISQDLGVSFPIDI